VCKTRTLFFPLIFELRTLGILSLYKISETVPSRPVTVLQGGRLLGEELRREEARVSARAWECECAQEWVRVCVCV